VCLESLVVLLDQKIQYLLVHLGGLKDPADLKHLKPRYYQGILHFQLAQADLVSLHFLLSQSLRHFPAHRSARLARQALQGLLAQEPRLDQVSQAARWHLLAQVGRSGRLIQVIQEDLLCQGHHSIQ